MNHKQHRSSEQKMKNKTKIPESMRTFPKETSNRQENYPADVANNILHLFSTSAPQSHKDQASRRIMPHTREATILSMTQNDPVANLPNLQVSFDPRSKDFQAIKKSATLYLDIDGLEKINDTRGYRSGDILLKMVERRLTNCLHSIDSLIRIASTTFIIKIRTPHNTQGVELVSKKITTILTHPYAISDGLLLNIGVSITPSRCSQHRHDPQTQPADLVVRPLHSAPHPHAVNRANH